MANISRGAKSGGAGTDFVDDTVIEADEFNVDFNTIYNEFNGQIDSTNLAANSVGQSELQAESVMDNEIASGANINPDKLDQTAGGLDAVVVDAHADNDAQYLATADPGDTDTLSLPNDLENEWERNRYAIRRQSVGSQAALSTGAILAGWVEPPARPGDLVYNGSFAVWSSTSPNAGDGWVTKGAPTTVETVSTNASEGTGNALRVVGGAGEGVAQQIRGLRSNTKYVILARIASRLLGDVINLTTDGAAAGTYTNLDLQTSGSLSYETLSGVVETDGVATDITINIIGTQPGDDWEIVSVQMFMMEDDVRTLPPSVTSFDQETGFALSSSPSTVPNLEVSVTPPGPGYVIRVWADYSVFETNNNRTFTIDLQQNISTVNTVWFSTETPSATGDSRSASLMYANTDPTPGVTYRYTIRQATGGAILSNDSTASIMVVMERGG